VSDEARTKVVLDQSVFMGARMNHELTAGRLELLSFGTRAIFCWFALVTMLSVMVCAQGLPPFDAAHANAYFEEARRVSEKDGGKLWGQRLYGPILFADQQSRAVIANQQDSQGLLHRNGDVFEGKLTDDIAPSNTPVEWAGTRWTMVVWQLIPEDRLTREKLFAHEMFHRIQPALHLSAPDTLNLQLDSLEGRVWLQLEWRALAAALIEHGPEQNQAIQDVLAFRDHRDKLFPGSAEKERSLEIAEGIPEYTGLAAAAPDAESARWYAVARLTDPENACPGCRQSSIPSNGAEISFVRSFAYTSGPAYALLLDERLPGWRTKLTTQSDLSALLASTVKEPPSLAGARASAYGISAIRAAENDRAAEVEATKARYRKLLVDGPTLTLPALKSFKFTFNPSSVVSLEGVGAVYPTFHASSAWGTLDVTDGALLPSDFSRVTVPAPKITTGTHIVGPGWILDLASGWRLVPFSQHGSFTVQKD
jgi:hypothetical protein